MKKMSEGSKYREYYQKYWDKEGWIPSPLMSQKKKEVFAKWINENKIVLDIGCGDAEHYGKYLVKRVKEYYGIDISQKAIIKAREKGIKAQVHDLGEKLPFQNNIFDVIICLEILEHLFNPEFALKEMHRVSKSGGVIIVGVPNAVYYRERIYFLFGKLNPRGSPETSFNAPWIDPHIRFFTKSTITQLLRKTGFEIIEFIGEGFQFLDCIPIVRGRYSKIGLIKRLLELIKNFLEYHWVSMCTSNFLIVAKKSA